MASMLDIVAIEKHFTIDNDLPGRDNKFAILPEAMTELSNHQKLIANCFKDRGLDY